MDAVLVASKRGAFEAIWGHPFPLAFRIGFCLVLQVIQELTSPRIYFLPVSRQVLEAAYL